MTLRHAYKQARERFRAQFKHEINAGGLACNPSALVFQETHYGYRTYRLLEKIVLEDENGRLFVSSLPNC